MYKFARIYLGFVFLLLFSSTIFSATFTVTKTADSNDGTCDADCSLREAVSAANGAAGDDVVNFDPVLFAAAQTVNVTLGEIVIANNGSLTINGTGARVLKISGNNTSRIISTTPNAVAAINGVTVTGGNGTGALDSGRGGGIYNAGGTLTINNSVITANNASNGGGLNNAASSSVAANLTLNNCIVSDNSATGSGGGMQNFSTSTVTINNSTFTGNSSFGTTGGGGGQFNGAVRITNSTFAHNSAVGGTGGGFQSNGTLGTIITNVTVARNLSTGSGGGINRGTTNTNFFIRNSIVADNNGPSVSPDITNSAGGIQSLGNNLIGIVGTSTGWTGLDKLNMLAVLSPFGFHGGIGNTIIPMPTSPAINGGQNCVVDLSCGTNNPPIAVTTDQRGSARPFDTTVDIGAVEASSDYVAILPSGRVNQEYGFTITRNANGYNYLLNSGTFGGLALANDGTTAVLNGVPNQAGTFDSLVQITNNTNSTTQKYRIIIDALPNVNVNVGGRVIDSTGQPLSNVTISISNGSGFSQTVTTSGFGYFSFTGIPFGQTYTISATSKRFVFTPQNVTPNGDVTDIVIVPDN